LKYIGKMVEAECPNCGNFMAEVAKVDRSGFYYDCTNCSYGWSIVVKRNQFRRLVSRFSMGLIYPENYDAECIFVK